MKTRVLAAALIAALVGCVVLAYLWVDSVVTVDYLKQSAASAEASARHMEGLLEAAWAGVPENEVLEKLKTEAARSNDQNIVVKVEKDVVWFDEIRFNFEKGKLKSIGGS